MIGDCSNCKVIFATPSDSMGHGLIELRERRLEQQHLTYCTTEFEDVTFKIYSTCLRLLPQLCCKRNVFKTLKTIITSYYKIPTDCTTHDTKNLKIS